MINLIKKKFERLPECTQESRANSVQSPEPLAPCAKCDRNDFWRPSATADWRCSRCSPAPSRSLVHETMEIGKPKIIDVVWIQSSIPICGQCRSMLTVETRWSDGDATERCWSCKAPASWETRPEATQEPAEPCGKSGGERVPPGGAGSFGAEPGVRQVFAQELQKTAVS